MIPFPGENHTCLRCRLHVGAKTLILYNVHFESPRGGLDAFREVRRQPWYLPSAIQQLEDNVEARLSQARALRELIRQEREPVVVAGDLNSPDASLACATLREAGLHDAFAEGGKGYGYTYGHFLLRRRLPGFFVDADRSHHVELAAPIVRLQGRCGERLRAPSGNRRRGFEKRNVRDVSILLQYALMDRGIMPGPPCLSTKGIKGQPPDKVVMQHYEKKAGTDDLERKKLPLQPAIF